MMSKASSEFRHRPVLFAECLEALQVKPDGLYIDCTAGGGGHAGGIVSRLGPKGRLIALDKDAEALAAAAAHIESLAPQASYELLRADFRSLESVLAERGLGAVDGILADLGVSSHQLDSEERGFAYQSDGPLDMRMDQRQALSAAELISECSEAGLSRIFREYGEERYSRAIAAAIVRARQKQPIGGTAELARIICGALPAAARREKHPARRCFQALRIAVNDELGALDALLDAALELLKEGGRLCVISFHSLEDRLVKQRFRSWESPCECPTGLPCVCGLKALGHVVKRQGWVAGPEENRENPRARSARLRVFERGPEALGRPRQ